jgi:dTDP-4-amino-4,6-dideoxygalactose transaminase
VDTGSSFLPSEINAAYLYAQIEHLEDIQAKRKAIWEKYYSELETWTNRSGIRLPGIPPYATNNGHAFYMVCSGNQQRSSLIEYLKQNGIWAVSHYISLHSSPYYKGQYTGPELPNSDMYTQRLVRLPLFYELTDADTKTVVDCVKSFPD